MASYNSYFMKITKLDQGLGRNVACCKMQCTICRAAFKDVEI